MSKSLILGYGEIGQAIAEVFSKHYKTEWTDIEKGHSEEHQVTEKYHALHVCIPWQENFADIVSGYIERHQTKLAIVHSTVPVGTTRKIVGNKVHAPVRGRHADLADGIRAYTMFVGFAKEEEMTLASEYLKEAKIMFNLCKQYETSEAAKLLELLQYGMNIEFARYAKRICDTFGVDYKTAVMDYGRTHNETIKIIDDADLQKPILTAPEGKIGGHCVLPGIKILNTLHQDNILSEILSRNDEEIVANNMATL